MDFPQIVDKVWKDEYITDEQLDRLLQWLLSEEGQKRFEDEIVSQWGDYSTNRTFDYEATLDKIHSRQGVRKPQRHRLAARRGVWAAAVAVVAVAGAALLLTTRNPTSRYAVHDGVSGSPNRAFLTLSDGRVLDLSDAASRIIDGSFDEIVNEHGSRLDYSSTAAGKHSGELVYHKISIPRGGEYSVILDDGTKVWLNSETVLEFPIVFVGDRREVRLSGEAYFEVAKDGARPFHVVTRHSSIEVTGTSFNVSAYPGEAKTAAVLETGSIVFRASGNEYPMRPGECAEYDDATQKTVVTEVDTRYYTAWRTGTLYFDDAPLSEIMKSLSRWYDIEVRFTDRSLEQLRFSGAAERKNSLNHILNLLENTQDVKFTTTKDKVVVVDKK